MEWQHPSFPKPKNANTTFLEGKVMTSFFWDVLRIDFLTEEKNNHPRQENSQRSVTVFTE